MNPKKEEKKSPDKIETDIAETRVAISEGIGAIGEKLSPEHLKQEAGELLHEAKEAGVEKLRELKDSAIESVEDATRKVGEQARRAGEATWEFARTNAVPLALIGLGGGLLAMRIRESRRDGGAATGRQPTSSPDFIERGKEKVREARETGMQTIERGMEKAKEGAREVSEATRTRARKVAEGARDLAQENPLALGAAALVTGFGVGMFLPETRAESELFGERPAKFADDVKEAAGDVGRAMKDTAKELAGPIETPMHH